MAEYSSEVRNEQEEPRTYFHIRSEESYQRLLELCSEDSGVSLKNCHWQKVRQLEHH